MELKDLIEMLPEENRDEAAELLQSISKPKRQSTSKYKKILEQINYDLENDTPNTFLEKTTKEKVVEKEIVKDESLMNKVQSLQEALDNERKKREEKEKAIANKYIEEKLKETIGGKLYGAKAIIKTELNRFELTDDEQIVGKDGLPFNTVIDEILEEYKEDIKPTQKKGVGVLKETTVKEDNDFKTALKEQLSKIRNGEPTTFAKKDL